MKCINQAELNSLITEIIPYPINFPQKWMEVDRLFLGEVISYYGVVPEVRRFTGLQYLPATEDSIRIGMEYLFFPTLAEDIGEMLVVGLRNYDESCFGVHLHGNELFRFLVTEYWPKSEIVPFISMGFNSIYFFDILSKTVYFFGGCEFMYRLSLAELWSRRAELDHFYPPQFFGWPLVDDRFQSGDFRIGFSNLPVYPPIYRKIEKLIEIFLPEEFLSTWIVENIDQNSADEIRSTLGKAGIHTFVEKIDLEE